MLSDLHGEIIDHLADSLPGVTVEAYAPDFKTRRAMALPACLIELATIEPYPDFGNRRSISRVLLQFEARVLVDPNVSTGWVDLKEFAAVVWWALRGFTPLTMNCGPVGVKRAGEDAFKPGLDGFLVWLIEFEIEAYLDFAPEEVEPSISRVTVQDGYGNETEVEK